MVWFYDHFNMFALSFIIHAFCRQVLDCSFNRNVFCVFMECSCCFIVRNLGRIFPEF